MRPYRAASQVPAAARCCPGTDAYEPARAQHAGAGRGETAVSRRRARLCVLGLNPRVGDIMQALVAVLAQASSHEQ
jgi:hypothetical protein